MALKRVNMNMDEALVDKVDAYASKLYVNRTTAFALIVAQFFEQRETMQTVSALAKLVDAQEQSGLDAVPDKV